MTVRYGGNGNGSATTEAATTEATTDDVVVDPRPAAWQTSKSGKPYDIQTFYTVSGDRDDPRANRTIKFPESLWDQADAVVRDFFQPQYSSYQALIRDALVHRLHWLNNEFLENPDPKIDALIETWMREAEYDKRRHELEFLKRHGQQTETLIDAYIEQDDFTAARDWLEYERERATEWREPYSSRYLRLYNRLEARIDKAESTA